MDREKIKADIKRNEGSIPYMYLDTLGNVTIAVGQLLPTVQSAQSLRLHVRNTGEPASMQQITQDYSNIAAQVKGMAASSYKKFTQLEMSEEDIDVLLDQRIDEFVNGLQTQLAGFAQFPDPAQQALLDMAFNLGLSGLVRKFPKLTQAASEQDWQTCAAECERRGISEQRNQSTRELFASALHTEPVG